MTALIDGEAPTELPAAIRPSERPVWEAVIEASRALRARFARDAQLGRLAEQVSLGLTLPEVLDRIYEGFRPLIPYDRLGLALIENEGRTVRSVWARSEADELGIGVGAEGTLAGSSLEEIIATGRPRVIPDLPAYARTHPASWSAAKIVAEGMRSSLTCPLIADGRPIGFLFFTSRTTDAYREVHGATFVRVAGHVAVMVEKARAYQRLADLNQQKSRFLGIAAHDLRSPLAVLQSYLDLLRMGDPALTSEAAGEIGRDQPAMDTGAAIPARSANVVMPPTAPATGLSTEGPPSQPQTGREAAAQKRRATYDRMQAMIGRMLGLINDLLDVTAIEAGRLEITPAPVVLATFLDEVLATNQPLAERKQIAIALEIRSARLPPTLRFDARRIGQVLDNLLGNAVKFSHPGTRVTLRVNRVGDRVRFSVIDQGQGIPKADLPKLFREFGKTSVRPTGGEKSTGLGLLIVRKIVETHGGVVEVSSRPGVGSTFWFDLPLAATGPAA